MNNSKKGRCYTYTDEMLNEIIRLYVSKNPNLTKLVPSKVARFAQEEFGFGNIRYSHFTNNKKIKENIDEFNKLWAIHIKNNKDDKNEQ